MPEFALISSLLREKCEENTELQKLCSQVSTKYLDSAKMEIRAQNNCEENIMLKLDIGNLESIYRIVNETNEALAELDSHIMEFYDEYLGYYFDIDECELEKLASYDEIKLELETRDCINKDQRLYERKLKMAQKMNERNIVKKYREAEEELSTIKTQRLHLEEKANKAKEFKARRLGERNLILQLVQGSVELETILAQLYPQKSQSQIKLSGSQRLSQFAPSDKLKKQKVGLSSRLLGNFEEFKVPTVPPMPRIRKLIQRNGLNRLLQQSEVIRKSMQTAPITLSCEFPTPKLTGILKTPGDHSNSTEGSQKSVSFDLNVHNSDKDVVNKSIETQDLPYSEFEKVSEMSESLKEEIKTKPKQIEITENVLLKPADKISKTDQPRAPTTIKRKADKENMEKHGQSPPTKMKFSPSEDSKNFGSKSFMEMFMELSKDTPSTPEDDTFKKPTEKNTKETIEKTKCTNPKTKASKKQFDGFEEFISQFAGETSDTKDVDDDGEEDQLDRSADMSFDFFQSDEPGQENDNGNLSFEI